MEPFFQAYREIMPFFINDSNEPERERLQTIEDRARFDDTTKCILWQHVPRPARSSGLTVSTSPLRYRERTPLHFRLAR